MQQLRQWFRVFRNRPGLTATALLTLALGVGTTAAMFSIVYSVFLAPLPYRQPDQLVLVSSTLNGERQGSSIEDYLSWKHNGGAFSELAAFGDDNFNVEGDHYRTYVNGLRVTPGYFPLLGIPLFLGRGFAFEKDQPNENVVILSHRLWQNLGGNRSIVGRQILLTGHSRPWSASCRLVCTTGGTSNSRCR